ncbi:Serine/threonine-protein kinase 19 [Linnemannia zychae]|nr:Serine/threonine-protein kinase 19 [Linnemannia zychae]
MAPPSSSPDFRRRFRGQSSFSQRRHQLSHQSTTAKASNSDTAITISGSNVEPHPTDTLGAIQYLLNLLRPEKIRQQKHIPRVCMIHQIYSLLDDYTTVDRTIDQLTKDGTLRKFYIGGTGSDEFAVMLTEDYIQQIDQAKEQYLRDQKEMKEKTSKAEITSSPSKRKADSSMTTATHSNSGSNKRLGSIRASTGTKFSVSSTMEATDTSGSGITDSADTGEIFDKFKMLVSSGHCLEISIQHSNIQDTIGATDQDITTLIRYSLLNRSLSAPANPHLINLEASTNRRSNTSISPGTNSNTAGSHSALNQLITATHLQHAKSLRADTPSSLPTSTAALALVPTSGGSNTSGPTVLTTTAITDAAARRGRITDDVVYRFAIRQGGLFVTHFLKGRLEILRMIKRQMFKDMLTSAITAKPLRGTFLPHEFHIHDLVGSGRVQSISTSSGQLLKLTQKGEASAKAG